MLMELGITKKAVLKRLRNGKSEPFIFPYHYVEFLLRKRSLCKCSFLIKQLRNNNNNNTELWSDFDEPLIIFIAGSIGVFKYLFSLVFSFLS